MTTGNWQDLEEGLSPDWVFSNCSNVHTCNDKKWFTEFTPFSSFVKPATFGDYEVPVEGIGAVNLPVKRGPNVRGPQAHHIIRLTNVLYVPSSVCNTVGMPIFHSGVAATYSVHGGSNSKGSLEDRNGSPVAYFSPNARLLSLRLSGPPIGPRLAPSKFDSNALYSVSLTWPPEERGRWEARVRQSEIDDEKDQWIGDQPYTAAEKAFLKKFYGNEFKFLTLYELSIYDEEDRAEGRAIARSLMRADAGYDDDDEVDGRHQENKDEDEGEEDEEEDENDFERHLADHHFDARQLDWIEENYRDSATFMYSFGLKFYDDDDCQEAKAILRSFMSD
ncbi:hypothetical protein V8C44DRAFT_323995 [Trichoderma aethiopicum]